MAGSQNGRRPVQVVVSQCCSFEMRGISVYAECEEKSPVEREEMTKLRMYNLEHKLWDQEGMVFEHQGKFSVKLCVYGDELETIGLLFLLVGQNSSNNVY